jgi:hypothetical protein
VCEVNAISPASWFALALVLCVAGCSQEPSQGSKDLPDEPSETPQEMKRVDASEPAASEPDASEPDEAPPSVQFSTPEDVWKAMTAAVKERDSEALWATFSTKNKEDFTSGPLSQRVKDLPSLPDESLAPMAEAVGSSVDALRAMEDDALFRTVMLAEAVKNESTFVESEWLGSTVTDDSATGTTRSGDGQEQAWLFVREGESWRFSGQGSAPAR